MSVMVILSSRQSGVHLVVHTKYSSLTNQLATSWKNDSSKFFKENYFVIKIF